MLKILAFIGISAVCGYLLFVICVCAMAKDADNRLYKDKENE